MSVDVEDRRTTAKLRRSTVRKIEGLKVYPKNTGIMLSGGYTCLISGNTIDGQKQK